MLLPELVVPADGAPDAPRRGGPPQSGADIAEATRGESGSLPSDLQSALSASLPAGRAPNVVVYLVDTLRADHLGTYGYSRPTSPSLDAMGSEGVVFDHAMAQSGWTRTSVASILTRLQPREHAVLDRDDTLSDEAITLTRLLSEQGYQTYAVVTNGNVGRRFGFDSFVYIGERVETEGIHQSSAQVNAEFLEWLAQRDVDRPFFAYLHSTDPHGPYTPREPYRSRFLHDPRLATLGRARALWPVLEEMEDLSVADAVTGLRDLYDAEIAYNDAHFGYLLDRLRASGLYDSTLVLFVSDHGEEFYDHGAFEHGKTLYSEMVFVPLVIKFPGGWAAGTRVNSRVQHVDIMPTILDLLDVSPPPGAGGDSLVPAISSVQAGSENEHFVGRRLLAHLDLDQVRMDSVLTKDHHLMEWYRGVPAVDGGTQLFGWREDTEEQLNLSDQAPVSAGYLRLVLRAMAATQKPILDSEDAVIDGELARRLRALGYIQ